MNARFKKYRFNGKMKHYSENSKLYKAYKQSIERKLPKNQKSRQNKKNK